MGSNPHIDHQRVILGILECTLFLVNDKKEVGVVAERCAAIIVLAMCIRVYFIMAYLTLGGTPVAIQT